MTTTAEPTTCPRWCVAHIDYSDDENPGRVEHQSEALTWSRKRGHLVELLQFDDDRTSLHITGSEGSELDAENVTPDDLLNLMRGIAKLLAKMHTGR